MALSGCCGGVIGTLVASHQGVWRAGSLSGRSGLTTGKLQEIGLWPDTSTTILPG